ncbi:hypothetical protein, partial [Citrobacter braakii]|uniref:hypothetical protein n=1 Tax=Citrobacter braakii TaxID=57706 RepID=UPI0019823C06
MKKYEPLEAAIAPYRQKWQVSGVDEATAIKQLLAASDWLIGHDGEPSADMKDYIAAEGLSFGMASPRRYL